MKKIKKIAQFLGIIIAQNFLFIFAGALFEIFAYFVFRRYGDAFLVQQKWLKLYLEHLVCWFVAVNGAAYLARRITSFKKFLVMECWLTGFTIAVGSFAILGDIFTLGDTIASIAGLLTALFSVYYYSYTENIFKES